MECRQVTEVIKVEIIVGSMTGDAATFVMGIELPEDVNGLWEILDERFGEPEDARLDALTSCI